MDLKNKLHELRIIFTKLQKTYKKAGKTDVETKVINIDYRVSKVLKMAYTSDGESFSQMPEGWILYNRRWYFIGLFNNDAKNERK